MSLPIPIPRCEISIRPGVISDLSFIDSLQKLHAKQVGWMPMKQLEEKVAAGHVLVAETVGGRQYAVGSEESVGPNKGSS